MKILFWCQIRLKFVCNKSKTTGATSGAEAAYPYSAPELTPVLLGSYCSIFSFLCNVLLIIVWPFVFFFFYYILFHFFPTGNDMFHAVEDIKNEISIPVFLMGTLNIPAEYKSWSQLMLMASSAEISRCVRAGLKLLMPCCYIYTSGTTG